MALSCCTVSMGRMRTGLMVAMYRILFEKWSREEAIEEMVYGGYGFHIIWQNIIHYLRNVDLDALRIKLGMLLRRNSTPKRGNPIPGSVTHTSLQNQTMARPFKSSPHEFRTTPA